jgi:hypothetical protein
MRKIILPILLIFIFFFASHAHAVRMYNVNQASTAPTIDGIVSSG